MPEPISLLILFGLLKAAMVKTIAAAPVKAAAASASIVYTTGAAGTIAGSVLVGITLTTVTMVAIGAVIDKVAAGGYMSADKVRQYAQKIEKLLNVKQQRIYASIMDADAHMVERQFHNHGVYTF